MDKSKKLIDVYKKTETIYIPITDPVTFINILALKINLCLKANHEQHLSYRFYGCG